MPLPNNTASKSYRAQWAWLVLGLSLVGGALAFNLFLEHGRAAAREQDRLATQARVITENTEHQLASANLALESIRVELPDWAGASGRQAGIRYLRAITSAVTGIRTMNVMDAKGTVLVSNRPELIGVDFSQREYFRTVKQHPSTDTLYVSPPFETALSGFAIVVARTIPGPRGEFAGIVTATLDREYFKTLMMSVQYAPDMWVSVAHGDGLLFLMMPERAGVQGMNLAQPGSFFTRHQSSGKTAEVLTGTVHATGEVRMMALQTVHPPALYMDKPLVVAVSRDLDAVFTLWQRNAMAQIGLFALIVVASIMGLLVHQRHQREFDQAAAETAAALQRSAERLQLATEASGVGVWDYDVVTGELVWDDSMYQLYGVDKLAASGLYDMWSSCVMPEDMPAADAALKATLEQGAPYTPCFRIRRHNDGAVRYIQARARVYLDADGKPLRIVGTNEDVTESEMLKERLEQQASQDYLTGLSNRRHFMEQGHVELDRAQRYGTPLSLLMLDIDHFKDINDSHGHKAGDIVLQKLSEIMRKALRTVDVIGRMGGEEFAVLLPETGLQRAAEVAERLREEVAGADVVLETGMPLHFTVSIGVAALGGKEVNLDMLLNQADSALYQAKEGGRNKVCVA